MTYDRAARRAAAFLCALVLTTAPRPASGQDVPPTAPPPAVVAEDRLRALEAQNQQLQQQLLELSRRHDDLNTRFGRPPAPAAEAPLPNIPGQLGRPIPQGTDVVETGDAALPRARVDLTQGVRFLSPDGLYRIEFHNLTQVEGRFYNPSGDPLVNQIDIPRLRFIFAGQVGQYFEFVSSTQRGYGSLDVFDAYINLKFDPAFNVRLGRTKTPYTYEYYKMGEGDLIGMERSVFVGNLSGNRQIGAMAFGRVWEDRLEYAAGVFDGPRRSFQDFNNFKTPYALVNARPFLHGTSDLLRYLNVGASGSYGRDKNPLEPNALRTANDETTTAAIESISPAFLKFNPGASQVGGTAFWSGDVAWFYRGLTTLAQYNGGYQTYALTQNRQTRSTRVPYTGGSVAVTYFLTGEEPFNRRELIPLREFDGKDPARNPGAVEVFSRAAYLHAGANVFASGLADPRLWSNDALVFDTGVSWYPNRYTRFTAEWQHSAFGSPVQVGPTRFTDSLELFWVRAQLYY